MARFLAAMIRQAYYDHPLCRWGVDKQFNFLVEAQTLRDAVDVCVKQAVYWTSQLSQGHHGQIDWENSIPNLSASPLARIWAEGQAFLS